MDKPEDFQFESQEALIASLKERVDDIDTINLFIDDVVQVKDPSGNIRRTMGSVGGQIKFCSGDTCMIHLDDMETLINDGILYRMGIKISLRTLKRAQ